MLNGVLLLDKPLGLSSHAALHAVKHTLQLDRHCKLGHAGTLDPAATGMLVVCMGEACKFSRYLLDAEKRYVFQLQLGVQTDTGDVEGEVIQRNPVPTPWSDARIERMLDQFRGSYLQTPPMFSALKHKGVPLYVLARKGQSVAREPRQVQIMRLVRTVSDWPYLSFYVHCSKGTYIRTLADDIGQAMGCGAHVTALHRTQVGAFLPEERVTLPQLADCMQVEGVEGVARRYLRRIETMLPKAWPQLSVSVPALYYFRTGQPIIVPHCLGPGMVRLHVKDGGFVGVGEIDQNGWVKSKRLVRTS